MAQARKSINEISADNAVLISEISRLERGTVVTYAEHFTRWLGRPVIKSEDMPNFGTVINRLRRDYDIVLSSVPKVGYRICTHAEVVASENETRRARAEARRHRQKLATVEISALNDAEKLQWAAKNTQAYLIEEAAKDKSLVKITQACSNNGRLQPLAMAKALEVLKMSNGVQRIEGQEA